MDDLDRRWLESFITQPVSALPFITPELPGIGGQIKATPAHFVVQEMPLYEPAGEGDHVYVCLTREGWTTRDLQMRLADLFGLREVDVGCAGLKDKQARATQVLSLLLPRADEGQVKQRIQDALPVEIEWVRRHRNKLRAGHLLGNIFRIVILYPNPNALAMAKLIAQELERHGVPNYYGAQRFGLQADNALRGRQVLFGRGPHERWVKRFLLAAYQSALFNAYLAARIQRGWFEQLLIGDVAKKFDTGGLFDVLDLSLEEPRFERREITYTGPIYGSRMRRAEGQPGALEQAVLSAADLTPDMLGRAWLEGSRRAARLFPWRLALDPHPEGLSIELALPKGAYATTVLREFIKGAVTVLPEE